MEPGTAGSATERQSWHMHLMTCNTRLPLLLSSPDGRNEAASHRGSGLAFANSGWFCLEAMARLIACGSEYAGRLAGVQCS